MVCFAEPFFFAPDFGETVVVEALALVALVERVEDDASGAESSTCFRWRILEISVGGSRWYPDYGDPYLCRHFLQIEWSQGACSKFNEVLDKAKTRQTRLFGVRVTQVATPARTSNSFSSNLHFLMPAEIFNPNPVIFSASKSVGRPSDLSAHSLWINDSSLSEDEADETEPIDQDEIYGMHSQPCLFLVSGL